MMTCGTHDWRAWVLNKEESLPLIAEARSIGINFFGTADMYSQGGSEEILGRALRTWNIPPDRAVIAAKLYNPMGPDPNQRGLSRKRLSHALDDSLRRLQTGYIDLYQTRRLDYDTPAEEIMEGLNHAVRAGKVL